MNDTPEADPLQAAQEKIAALEGELHHAHEEHQRAAQQTQARVLYAELKALAAQAGMVDLDGLKLLDLSGVQVSAAGEIEGAASLLAQARKAKPYLFHGAGTTSNPTSAPMVQASQAKHARDMSAIEYAKAKAKLLRG